MVVAINPFSHLISLLRYYHEHKRGHEHGHETLPTIRTALDLSRLRPPCRVQSLGFPNKSGQTASREDFANTSLHTPIHTLTYIDRIY